MDIRFIYFDLDDTLLDHGHAEREALSDVRQAFAEAFEGVTHEDLHRIYHENSLRLWRQYADGLIDKDTLKLRRFEHTLDELEVRQVEAEAVSTYYLQQYAKYWRFIPGARAVFRQLAERVPVGVLTNGFAEVQHDKLDRFPVLRERSHAIIISEETGYLKPHPEVFAHATRAADVPAEYILYVGDSYRSDVQGGQAAGWKVAWYARDAAASDDPAPAHLTFEAWNALPSLLSEACGLNSVS